MPRRTTHRSKDGETETVGSTQVTHRFVEVPGALLPVRWHVVTAGDPGAEPVLFVHGNPESWRAWEPQIEAFADRYHVVAIDLKGYGQSDKRHGDWRWETCAEELLALLDRLDLSRVSIVAHDRGCVISDYLAGNYPEWVRRYVRMQQVCHILDPSNSPQGVYFADPLFGPYIFDDPDYYFEFRLERMLKNPVPLERLEVLKYEMSYPGLAEAVVRYYQASSFEKERVDRGRLLPRMSFPVLLLQGDRDDGQPRWYYDHPASPAAGCFPEARLEWVEGAGHYTNLEKPEIVTESIARFFGETASTL